MCALVETGLGRESIDGHLGHQTSKHDLKIALRQADRQQNVIRKTKTWNSERTAFEPPQPQAVPKEKGVRNAIRRQTRKLKKTTPSRPPTAVDSRPPSLFRSDSFDYGDEFKRRPTQVHFAPPAEPAPRFRDARSDAKTQLLILKAQQKQRRAEQKAAEKRTKEHEKAQRQALARQAKQEKILEYLRALTSRHPRKNLERVRYGPSPFKEEHLAQQQYVPLQHSYHRASVSPDSWLGQISALTDDLVSPVTSPAPQLPNSQQGCTPSPARVSRWSDFSNKEDLLAHLGGGQEAHRGSCHRPQELPAYERLSAPQQKVEPVEVPTDLPDRELQMCRTKPNLVYCDICSATVSLSGVFYSCTICGPREGGIVCSGCQQDNRKCHGGLHDLESSMQVVQRFSPVSTFRAHESSAKVIDTSSKNSETSENSTALSRISADTASHSLCLATMQKKMTKVEVGIETQSKTTERLASWLEDAMERQKEQAADLTKSMLDEFRAKRIANMNTIKRLSTKRKPRRQASEGSTQLKVMLRDNFKEREMALRERDLTLRERKLSLQERREAAKERAEKSTLPSNPLPSQSLASAPNQENRVLLNVLNKLDRIEGLSALSLRQAPSFDEKLVEQVIERAMSQLTLVTSGFREHADVKRKADSTGTVSSIQSTPTTGLSTDFFLQPPARKMSRGNQDDDEGDGHSPKRPKTQPPPVPESGKKMLLACPYSKMDFNRYSHRNVNELNYRGCSSCVLSDISRLKQHLYRVHQYPEHHCPRCFDDLLTKEQLNTHLRDGCQQRACPYPEKFSDSSKLKKKWPRKSMTECWYMVFKILFPGHRLPASPYAEDLATSGVAIGVADTPPQHLPTLSLSPEVISSVVRRQLERRSIIDPDQHALLLSILQDATTEALGLLSASPTPVTNSNPSSAVPHSGTYATSPGPESALAGQDEAVDPTFLSAGSGTTDSAFGPLHNLQDLSSLGSGVAADISAPLPGPSPAARAMSSNQSSGTFSGLSPLLGTENLMMDFDDDMVRLTSNEVMAPIRPSNSTRTVDSGYASLMRTNGVLDCYPLAAGGGGGDGPDPRTTSGSSGGTGNQSVDSLLDPETYERLVREHGDDVMSFDWNVALGSSGVGGGMFET